MTIPIYIVPSSFFSKIHSLEAGTHLIVTKGKVEKIRYWDLPIEDNKVDINQNNTALTQKEYEPWLYESGKPTDPDREELNWKFWEDLYKKPKKYKRGEVPKDVSVILASTDVQADRLETVIVGWNRKKAYIIDYFISEGNTYDLESECWQSLDDIMTKKWGGLELKAMSIDAQYNTTTVTKYARHRSKIYPINGLDRWDCPVFPPKPMLTKSNSGKWFRTGKKRWPLGVSLLKADLYNRLKLDESSRSVQGSQVITYTNNSPLKLNYIWFTLGIYS